MPSVDEFVWVFIAGVMALVVAFLISGVQFQGQIEPIAEFSVGEIGFTTEVPVRSDDLGSFTLGERQTITLQRIASADIFTNYVTSGKETLPVNIPSAYQDTLDRVRIRFVVQDTNQYGDLVISWNGRKVLDDTIGKGLREVSIPKDSVRNANSLEIKAENPGLRFWASTAYQLQDLTVDVEYGPERIVPVELSSRDLQALNRGVISFFANAQENRTMRILFNGIKIYEKPPPQQDSAEFSLLTVPIVAGTNVITFSAPQGPIQLAEAKLEIFLSTNQLTRTRSFNLTQEHIDQLNSGFKGKVRLTVDEVKRPGSIEVTINNNKVTIPSVAQGENTGEFPAAFVSIGENQVTFSGTGDFVVSTAIIGIER
ncbi:MAG: hypothetical protein HY367_04065 [Candidatus Aenigmarchaeota archaeon]|nr:hypothetical protein [Candidatus Aenigmarchaeota archaeon]